MKALFLLSVYRRDPLALGLYDLGALGMQQAGSVCVHLD